MQRSPAATGPRSDTASSPSSSGVPSGASKENAPGQSSADHRNSGFTLPPASHREASGVQGEATPLPPSGPAKMRSPSPDSRWGPQTKHVGNGWERKPRYDFVAASASARLGAAGMSRDSTAGRARATTVAPLSSSTPVPASFTSISVSSGGGTSSRTTAGPWMKAASRPQTYPPLPDSGGPQKRLSILMVFSMPSALSKLTIPATVER